MNEIGDTYIKTLHKRKNKLAGRYLASINDQRNSDSDDLKQPQKVYDSTQNSKQGNAGGGNHSKSSHLSDSSVPQKNHDKIVNTTSDATFSNSSSRSLQRNFNEMNMNSTLVNKKKPTNSTNRSLDRFASDRISDDNEMNKENNLANKNNQSKYPTSLNRAGRFTPDRISDNNMHNAEENNDDRANLNTSGVSSRYKVSSHQIAQESSSKMATENDSHTINKPSWRYRAHKLPSNLESSLSDKSSKFQPIKGEADEKFSNKNIEGKRVLKFVNDKIVIDKPITHTFTSREASPLPKSFEASPTSANFRRALSPSARYSLQRFANKNSDSVLGIKKVDYQTDQIGSPTSQLIFNSKSNNVKESSSNNTEPNILSRNLRPISSRQSTPSNENLSNKNSQSLLTDINSMVQDVQEQQQIGLKENDLSSFCSKLQTTIKELSKTVLSDQREIESKSLSVSNLQNDLDNYKSELKDSKSKVVSLNEMSSNKEASYQQKIDEWQYLLNESKDESSFLTKKLEKTEVLLNSSRKNEHDLNEKVEKLQIEARNIAVSQSPEVDETNENRINELHRALDDVDKENSQLKEIIDSFQDQSITNEENERSLNEKINDFQLDVSDLVEMNDELERALVNQKNEYESVIDGLRRELRRSEIELHSSKNALCSTSRDMIALQDCLESSRREQNALKVESQMQLKAIQNSITKLAMARKSQEEMQRQLHEIKEENSALKSSAAQQAAVAEERIAERDSIKDDNAAFRSSTAQQVAALESYIAERDSNLNKMKSNLASSSQEIQSMKQFIDVLQVQVNQLEVDISGKEDLLSSKNCQLHDINMKLSKSHNELGLLENNMKSSLAQNYEESSKLENELRSVLPSELIATNTFDASEEVFLDDESSIEIILHDDETHTKVLRRSFTKAQDHIHRRNVSLVQSVKCQLSGEMLKTQSGWIACYAEVLFTKLLQEEIKSEMDENFIQLQSARNDSHVESIVSQSELAEVRNQMNDYVQNFQEALERKNIDLRAAKKEVEEIEKMQRIYDLKQQSVHNDSHVTLLNSQLQLVEVKDQMNDHIQRFQTVCDEKNLDLQMVEDKMEEMEKILSSNNSKEQSAHNRSHVALLNSQLRYNEMQTEITDSISKIQSVWNNNNLCLDLSPTQDKNLNSILNGVDGPKQIQDFELQASNDASKILSAWNKCVEFTFSQMYKQAQLDQHLCETERQAHMSDVYQVESAWNINHLTAVFSLLQQFEEKIQSLDVVQNFQSDLKGSNESLGLIQKQFADYMKKSSDDFDKIQSAWNCSHTELIFRCLLSQDTEEKALVSREAIVKHLHDKNETIEALAAELQSKELDLQLLHENYCALLTHNNYFVRNIENISTRIKDSQIQPGSTLCLDPSNPRSNQNRGIAQKVGIDRSEMQVKSGRVDSHLSAFNFHTRIAKVDKIESLFSDMTEQLSTLQNENTNLKVGALEDDKHRSKLDAALNIVNADFVQVKMLLEDMHRKYESNLGCMQSERETAKREIENMKSHGEIDLQRALQMYNEKIQEMQKCFIESIDEKKSLIAALRQELQVCMCEMKFREERISSLEDQIGEDKISDQQLTEMRDTILKSECENEKLFVQLFQNKIQLGSIQQEYLRLEKNINSKNDEFVQLSQRFRQKNDEVMSLKSELNDLRSLSHVKTKKLKLLVYSSTSALNDERQNVGLKRNEIKQLRSLLSEQQEYIMRLEFVLNSNDKRNCIGISRESCSTIETIDSLVLSEISNLSNITPEVVTSCRNEVDNASVDSELRLESQLSSNQAMTLNLFLLLAENDNTSNVTPNDELQNEYEVMLQQYTYYKMQNFELNASIQALTDQIGALQSKLTNAEERICVVGLNEQCLKKDLEESRMWGLTYSLLQDISRNEMRLLDVKVVEDHDIDESRMWELTYSLLQDISRNEMRLLDAKVVEDHDIDESRMWGLTHCLVQDLSRNEVRLLDTKVIESHQPAMQIESKVAVTVSEKSNASNAKSELYSENQNEACEILSSVNNEKDLISLGEKDLLRTTNNAFEVVVSRLETQLQNYEIQLEEKNANEFVLKSKIQQGHKQRKNMYKLLNETNKELERAKASLKTVQTSSKMKVKQLQALLFNSSSNIHKQDQKLLQKNVEIEDLRSINKEINENVDEAMSKIMICLGMAVSDEIHIVTKYSSSSKCKEIIGLSNAVVTKLGKYELELSNASALLTNEQNVIDVLNRELQEMSIHSMLVEEEISSLKMGCEALKLQLCDTKTISEQQFSSNRLEIAECWKQLVKKQAFEDYLTFLNQNFQKLCILLCQIFTNAYEIESSIKDPTVTKDRVDVLIDAAAQFEDKVIARFKFGAAYIDSSLLGLRENTLLGDTVRKIITYLSTRPHTLLMLKGDLMEIPVLKDRIDVMNINFCEQKINNSELQCKLMDSQEYANNKETQVKVLKKKLASGRKQMNDMVIALNVMTEELNTAGRGSHTCF